MMILVIGGSGSGKSAWAEEKAAALADRGELLYYLATMQIRDEEAKKKVIRHRQLRKGKGFQTLEYPRGVGAAVSEMPEGAAVLLECISNLTANEMFAGTEPLSAVQTAEAVLGDLKKLKERTKHLIIVTNNVFEDGIRYEEATLQYMEAVGSINRKLAAMADEVTEVVVGIAVPVKRVIAESVKTKNC